jgi:hypothetical protein
LCGHPYFIKVKGSLTNFMIRKRGENLQAYILINTEPGKPWEVTEATQRIEGVKMGTRGNWAI